MKTQVLSLDRISTLPENIIESILSLMPIRDAVRTSILSKKWRYSWQSMPKLVCTQDMVKVPSGYGYQQLEKRYKLVSAIFHVLLLHDGPRVLKLVCYQNFNMDTEFYLIMSYLARGTKLKQLIFVGDHLFFKLPISFFSLQGLELIHLEHCTLKPPSTFNGFSRLKSMKFYHVNVYAEMLQWFLSKCPLLEHICLDGFDDSIDYIYTGNRFTFVDLFQCVPLIRSLDISEYYLKYLSEDDMPHKLPTSLVHLKHLLLELCLMDQNDILSALCLIRSAPVLERITFRMNYNNKLDVQQTSTNFLDQENHSELKLDHLEILVIEWFNKLPVEIEFMKLIIAKSPVLKKVEIDSYDVSVDEERKLVRDFGQLSSACITFRNISC